MYCNTLQHTATPCDTLQHIATQYFRHMAIAIYLIKGLVTHELERSNDSASHQQCDTLFVSSQIVAYKIEGLMTHKLDPCNTLQHVAAHGNNPQQPTTH